MRIVSQGGDHRGSGGRRGGCLESFEAGEVLPMDDSVCHVDVRLCSVECLM